MELGEYEIPDVDIGTAKAITYTIEHLCDGVVTYDENEEDLAIALGHDTHESGAFRSKLTDLDKYGLIEGRKDRAVTSLGQRLLENETEAMPDILDRIDLFRLATQEFGQHLPTVSEWENFLAEENIKPVNQKSRPAWKRYISMARSMPARKESGIAEPLDVEDDFEFYFEKLDNPRLRHSAMKALEKNLKRKQWQSMEPWKTVIHEIKRHGHSNDREEFYRLLRIMSSNSEIEGELREELVELFHDRLVDLSREGNFDKQESQNILHYIQATLESLNPPETPRHVLDLGLQRLEEGAALDNKKMRSFTKQNLLRWVMVEPFRERFENELAEDTETDIWNRMEQTDDEDLRDDYDKILHYMGVT